MSQYTPVCPSAPPPGILSAEGYSDLLIVFALREAGHAQERVVSALEVIL